MKKVLSVFMAMLMLFAALSVGVSASSAKTDWFGGENPICSRNQVVVALNLNGGTLKNDTLVYNPDTGVLETWAGKDVKGIYYMVPANEDAQLAGTGFVTLPAVTAMDGYQFDGWTCTACNVLDSEGNSYVGQTFAANSSFKLPAGTGGTVIQFMAAYSPAEIGESTLDKVMGILFKVFGAIIGLLLYQGDTAAGIAAMEKIFGGLF